VAQAQYDISWSTIDGGGFTNNGGVFTLSGTIGQPDAQTPPAMSGDVFTLTGGFWPGTADACTLPGDLNHDGLRDGQDVQGFVNCIVGMSGSNCECAEFDGTGGVSLDDLAQFVAALLAG